MQIEVRIDSGCKEPKVVIHTDRMTDEIQELVRRLSDSVPQLLAGFRDGDVRILEQSAICRAYAREGKVYAVTDEGEHRLRLRLYELEERLDRASFVRISNAEIINLRHVKCFDLSYTGTICVRFLNGAETYVSRRYVKKIRQTLGI